MPCLRHETQSILLCLLVLIFSSSPGCGRKDAAKKENPAIDTKANISADAPIPSPAYQTADQTDSKKERESEDIMAQIGDYSITIDAFKQEFALLPPEFRDVPNFDKKQFLENLINKHLLLQEAKRENLEQDKEVEKLIEKVKEEILIQELIDKELGSKAQVSDEEIEKHYLDNRDAYTEPEKIRAKHILVESQLLAIKILSDLKEGSEFEELAKKYSLDIPTRDNGGDLGYFTKGTLLPDFEQACEELKIGGISKVVKTDIGYHIIKLIDRKDARIKTLEEAKEDIKNELAMNKELSLYKELIDRLRKEIKISINSRLLENIEMEPQGFTPVVP